MKKGRIIAAALAAVLTTAALPVALSVSAKEINGTIDAGENATTTDNNVWLGSASEFNMQEGGYFRLEYTASQETDVHLVFRKDKGGNEGWSWDTLTDVYTHGAVEGYSNRYFIECTYSNIFDFITSNEYSSVNDIVGINAQTWGFWDDTKGKRVSCPVSNITVDWINHKIPINETIDADDNTPEISDTTSNVNVSSLRFSEGGRLRVTYSCECETSVAPVLRDSHWGGWTQYNTPDIKGTLESGSYYEDFRYDTLKKGFGSNFSDVTYLNLTTWGVWDSVLGKNVSKTAEIQSIEWIDDIDHHITLCSDNISVDKEWAGSGETVTITPKNGYRISGSPAAVKTGETNTSLTVTEVTAGSSYAFTMPDYDVTVDAVTYSAPVEVEYNPAGVNQYGHIYNVETSTVGGKDWARGFTFEVDSGGSTTVSSVSVTVANAEPDSQGTNITNNAETHTSTYTTQISNGTVIFGIIIWTADSEKASTIQGYSPDRFVIAVN